MVQVTFNGVTYNLVKNIQTGYYEVEVEAPSVGGIYTANVVATDSLNNTATLSKDIQILTKEAPSIETDNLYMWVFDWRDFAVKTAVEIVEAEIVEDEETNAPSNVTIIGDSGAKSGDIVAIKRNGEIVYWGIIDEIQNENGEAKFIYKLKYITNLFDQGVWLNQVSTSLIRNTGVEDYIAGQINANFINNTDTFVNKTYLQVNVLTHSPKNIQVSNVENNIFNLHTWMSNCTQLYDIEYRFYIANGKLNIDIENVAQSKILIDTNFGNISDYNEVIETQVTAKVWVLTDTNDYKLYLLNNRTTTTNQNDPNRAAGKVDVVYTAQYADAPQAALDAFKSNSYNHNITFKYDKYIPVGTPIAIKTKNQAILDSYISKVTINSGKFYEYECGNIRINFIDKILKEKK